MSRPIITLTTDFGVMDSFVGSVRAVIRSISSAAEIIDITHDVPAYDVHAGAFIFDSVRRFFPSGTIHLLIVDPGVGTDRTPLLVVGPDMFFVCPDNGILSYTYHKAGIWPQNGCQTVPLPDDWQAYRLDNKRYWLNPISKTFHGRDIFAPVAAYVSMGVEPGLFGTRLDSVVMLDLPMPTPTTRGVRGVVIHVDKFGNLITNIEGRSWAIEGFKEPVIEISGHLIEGLSNSYQQYNGKAIAIVGSSGYIEIAVPNGDASKEINCGLGSAVHVRPLK